MKASVQVERHDDVIVIYCRGSLLAGETEEIRAAALSAIEETGCIILHVQGVSHMDSAGLGLLARLCVSARRRSGDVKLVDPPAAIAEFLQIALQGRLLTVYPTVEEALAAFSQHKHPV